MKIVAKVEICEMMSAAPSTLWEKTKSNAGITRKKYREYFHGHKVAYAYRLGAVERFDPPQDLAEYNLSLAPQSFSYIDID